MFVLTHVTSLYQRFPQTKNPHHMYRSVISQVLPKQKWRYHFKVQCGRSLSRLDYNQQNRDPFWSSVDTAQVVWKKMPLPLLRNSVDWIIAHTVLVCVLLNTENSCLSISVQSDVSSLNASYPNVSVNQTRHALDTLTNKYAL